MTEPPSHAVPLNQPLCRSQDKQFGMRWPIAVDEHLDKLVNLINTGTDRTNRKELVAALIAATSPSADQLVGALRRYRSMQVSDLLADSAADSDVIYIAGRRPGPRTAQGR
jgi:hypothetical protein